MLFLMKLNNLMKLKVQLDNIHIFVLVGLETWASDGRCIYTIFVHSVIFFEYDLFYAWSPLELQYYVLLLHYGVEYSMYN